ncbi:DUF1799 domain-containing protein [Vreelandella venusta]|uniref:DUF1799 domain-containing protein n=1 Tax=Vreelandella venusta TaxID=44935 RepID=UPI0013DE4306|nr:DUF1799 domain-containing protein [Halomonas venusta]
MWEEHWPALELFLAMRTQWRVVAGMVGIHRQGIDYNALYGHPKFARLGFDEQDALLAQIQHIEAGALAVLNDNPIDDSEERQQVAEVIEKRAELSFLQEEIQRINVRELMNVMDLPLDYRSDGLFLA